MEEIFEKSPEKIEDVPTKKVYKMLTSRGKVLFPGQSINFDVVRDKSSQAIRDAIAKEETEMFLVNQRHASSISPAPQDVYRVGVIAKIKQVQRLPGDGLRVTFVGSKRMIIDKFVSIRPYFEVTLNPYEYEESDPIMFEGLRRQINEILKEYRHYDTKMPGDILSTLTADEPERFIANFNKYIFDNDTDQQNLLQMKTVVQQYEAIYARLAREIQIRAVERKISKAVRDNIDKNQREYYLREQIHAIKEELGEGDSDDINTYTKKLEEIKEGMPDYAYEKCKREISRLDKMSPSSPDANVSRSFIELILELPWNKRTESDIDLTRASKILDEEHYGLDKVKERIIEYLAVFKLTHNFNAPILCFVGPPGVGKTSIVSSIARASGRELVSMSLGGLRDEAEIRGHRRTYVAAMPGRIVAGIRQSGVMNPVFLLDEIDKTSSDFRGDPASALLEVLDPKQNVAFKDNYLDMPFDLSDVMFITTANSLDTIPAPLLDRMEIIQLTGYTQEEKLQIAKRYLKPKQIEMNGLKNVKVDISDSTCNAIISEYTRESGVRGLEREIATIARKIAVKVANMPKHDKKHKADASEEAEVEKLEFKVTKKDLLEYLGAPKYKDTALSTEDKVGEATGLAWTSVGGVTLAIEVALIEGGKGELKLTGSLGDVMKESCLTALTLVRTHAKQLGINPELFSTCDIHIHFPEGAVPKDGPSAGITISTALASAFSERKIAHDVAMTGEVTLRGNVLAIGGLKEKSLAAYRAGIKRLIIPKENEKDCTDLPKEVTDKVKIIFADNIKTVFDTALLPL